MTDNIQLDTAEEKLKSRYFFAFYVLACALFVSVLFRDFLFSDMMLYGGDTIRAGIFFRSFLVDYFLEHLSIPQWNPYIWGGLPYVEAFHGDIFYPLSFLKYFGELYRSLGYVLVYHIFLAGIFMYLAARQLGLGKVASSVSGSAYMCSAYLISFVAAGNDGKLFVTALFPLLILFTDRAFKNSALLNSSLGGAVVGLMLLAPHPQMAYYSLIAAAVFFVRALYKTHIAKRSWKKSAIHTAFFAFSVILGIAISAIQMLPGVHYTMNYSPRTTEYQGYRWASSWSLNQEELVSQIVPEFVGTDSETDGSLHYWGRNSFKDNSETTGTIAMFLFLIGVLFFRRKGTLFWSVFALAVLLYSMGNSTPFFKLFYWFVPLISKLRAPAMSMFLFSFAVSIIGGMFIQSLVETKKRGDGFGAVLKVFIIGFPLFLLFSWLLFTLAGEETLRLYSRIFYPSLLGTDRLNDAIAYLPYIKSGFLFAFVFMGAVTILIWLRLLRKIPSVVLLCIPLLIMINSVRFNSRFVQLIDYESEFGKTPEIELLQKEIKYNRTVGYAMNAIALHNPKHRISSIIGYHGNELKWYRDLITANGSIAKTFFSARLVNLMGVSHIMYPVAGKLALDTLGPIPLDTAGIFKKHLVFRNHNQFPRSYFVNRYTVVEDRSKIYPEVLRGNENLRELVYLEEEPKLEIDSLLGELGNSTIEFYSPDSISISVVTPKNQLLILTDNWYPAWHVYVDGVERRILRAYGALRAVEVPAGSKRVEFVYQSSVYQIGKYITLFSCSVLFSILGLFGYRRIKRLPKKLFAVK